MSIIGGVLDSSGVIDGEYLDWEFRFVPLTVTLLDPVVQAEVETPSGGRQFSFLIEVEDVDLDTVETLEAESSSGSTSLVTDVAITRSVEAQTDQFTLALTNARLASPRTGGIIVQDIRKRIRIHVGMHINGTVYWFRVFTGVPMGARSESWTEKGSSMTVSGFSVTYLLTRFPGQIEEYTGTLSGLVMDLLAEAGITDFVFAFDDALITEAVSVAANTVQEALADLFRIDPSVQWTANAYGMLFLGNPGADQDPAFTYQLGKNVTKFMPNHDPSQVVTETNVIGGSVDGSGTFPSLDAIDRFGRMTGSVSSALILTEDGADAAADQTFARSERALKKLGFDGTFNPVLEPAMAVTVDDPRAEGSEISGVLKVMQFTFSIKPTGVTVNVVSGEFDSEV